MEINKEFNYYKVKTANIFDSIVNVEEHGTTGAKPMSRDKIGRFWCEHERQDYDNMLGRPAYAGSFNWSTGDAVGPLTNQLNLPTQFLTPMKKCRADFQKYLRTNLEIRFMVNGTRFMAGRLLAYWAPLSDVAGLADVNETLSAITGFPHVFLNPSENQTMVMTIPFINILHYLSLNPISISDADWTGVNSMGTVRFFVVNRLLVNPAATTNVGIRVLTRLVDPILSIPTFEPSNLVAFAQSGDLAREEEGVSGVISKVVKTATDVLKPIGAITNMLGFNKPLNAAKSDRLIPLPLSGLTHGDGVDTAERLTVAHDALLEPDSEVFGSAIDEMDLRTITKTYGIVQSYEWKDDVSAQSIIGAVNLHPTVCTVSGAQFNATVAGWTAMAFNFWKGSIRVKIQLVANQFQSGRVYAVYIPPGATIPASFDLTLTDNLYHQMIDLSGPSETEIIIPWNHLFGVKPTRLFENAAVNAGTTISDDSLGALGIYCANPIRSANAAVGSSVSVKINVFLSMTDDVEFFFPSLTRINTYEISDWSLFASNVTLAQPIAEAQAGDDTATGNNSSVTDNSVAQGKSTNSDGSNIGVKTQTKEKAGDSSMGKSNVGKTTSAREQVQKENSLWASSNEPGVVAKFNYGESIVSLRTLLHRSCVFANVPNYLFDATPDDDNLYVGMLRIEDFGPLRKSSPTGSKLQQHWTFYSWFGCIFRFRRGGLRWKVVTAGSARNPYLLAMTLERMTGQNNTSDNPYSAYDSTRLKAAAPLNNDQGGWNEYQIWQSNAGQVTKSSFQRANVVSTLVSQGAMIYSSIVNPVVEVEIPNYCPGMNKGPMINDLTDLNTSLKLWPLRMFSPAIVLWYIPSQTEIGSGNPRIPPLMILQSVADDFQFGFIVGPPSVSIY